MPDQSPEPRGFSSALRWQIAMGTFIVVAGLWYVTADFGTTEVRVLGGYRERYFLLNLVVSYFALPAALMFALRANFKAIASWIALTIGLVFVLCMLEAVAIIGVVDFRPLLLGKDRNPDLEHQLRRRGRPNTRWEGEFNFDLVKRMGVQAEPFPIVFATDQFGLRNPEGIEDPKVFVAGDSIVVGMPVPVDLTVGQRVGQLVNQASLSVGEVGYSPQESLGRLDATGLIRPGSAVVHLVFEGNDAMDSRKWRKWSQRPFHADWPLSGFFKSTMVLLKSAAPAAAQARNGWVRDVPNQADSVEVHFLYDAKHSDVYIGEMPELARDLETAAADFKAREVFYLLVFVPQKLSVFHAKMTWPEGSPLADPAQATSQFRAEFAQFAQDSGIPFVDALEPLAQCFDLGELPFYPADTHLAPCGHDAIARAVAPFVLEYFENFEARPSS